MARKNFYIAAHNPNTIKEAVAALKEGANALAPDVHYDEDKKQFYVYHLLKDGKAPTLRRYLTGISAALKRNSRLNLALIIFDVKPPYTYNLKLLYRQIRKYFTQAWPGTAIITSINNPEDLSFLLAVKNYQLPNEAVGADENSSAEECDTFMKGQGLNYVYGNGISAPLLPTTQFADDVAQAIEKRNRGNSFKMVYAWTVNSDDSMRAYLDLDVDALITDKVPALKELLLKEYAARYAPAAYGHNLFL